MAAALDLERIDSLLALGHSQGQGVIEEIFTQYLADSIRQIDAMSRAALMEDPHSLWRTAHTLKGASANLGMPGMRELAARIEALGRGGETVRALELLDALRGELARVRSELGALTAAP